MHQTNKEGKAKHLNQCCITCGPRADYKWFALACEIFTIWGKMKWKTRDVKR